MRTEMRPPETRVPAAPTRHDRTLMVAAAVASVWVAVAVASVFTPDMISGSLEEHLPIAALTMWLWGAIATAFIVMTGAMGRGTDDDRWRGTAVMIIVIWAAVAVAAIWAPELVTGTDPTRIPLAAILAPIAGTIGTAFVCLFSAGTTRR